MAYGLVGLYGLFLIFVGSKGNAAKLQTELSSDAKGFSAWLIAILVLRALYSVDAVRPVVKPFMYLALLTFFLKNYSTVVNQVDEITGLNINKKPLPKTYTA